MAPDRPALTDLEHRAMELTRDLWEALVGIVGTDRSRGEDLAELVAPLHVVQNAILAQAAARVYPGRYRLLGETLEPDREKVAESDPFPPGTRFGKPGLTGDSAVDLEQLAEFLRLPWRRCPSPPGHGGEHGWREDPYGRALRCPGDLFGRYETDAELELRRADLDRNAPDWRSVAARASAVAVGAGAPDDGATLPEQVEWLAAQLHGPSMRSSS